MVTGMSASQRARFVPGTAAFVPAVAADARAAASARSTLGGNGFSGRFEGAEGARSSEGSS